jgi:hypothetical protein
MSKGNTFETSILNLIFKGTAITSLADNAASSPATNLWVALHTADPGEAGTQTTSEATYNGYARVAVARGAGWTVSGNSVSPAANIDFPANSGSSQTLTHFSVSTASSGGATILYYGAISPNIVANTGLTPRLTTATAITED